MREVIGHQTLDEGLFRQFVLSNIHQRVQAILVSSHNNPGVELATFVDRIIEIPRTISSEIYSDKKFLNRQNTMSLISILLSLVILIFTLFEDTRELIEESRRENDLSVNHGVHIILTSVSNTVIMINHLEISGKLTVS